MSMIEQHIEDCMDWLDEPHKKVHRWLDEYAKTFPISLFNDYHRTFRHNTYGLKCIYGMWGEKAHCAALIHLSRDYIGNVDNLDSKFIGNMMMFYDNPMNMDLVIDSDILNAWIKEGFGLVALSTRDIINVGD